MRFNLLADRIMVPAMGLALAATVAACSSSSSSSASSPAASSSPSAPASSSAPASPAASASATSPGNSAAVSEIKTNWETFFNGRTPASKKITLLQNGQKYATVIRAQAGSGLASTAAAEVTAVVLNSATTATVAYDIKVSGTTALPNQTGTAVYEAGTWKVSDVSFCQLLKLEGTAPSGCPS